MFVTHSLIFHNVFFYVRPRSHLPFSLENGDFTLQFGLPCENAPGGLQVIKVVRKVEDEIIKK